MNKFSNDLYSKVTGFAIINEALENKKLIGAGIAGAGLGGALAYGLHDHLKKRDLAKDAKNLYKDASSTAKDLYEKRPPEVDAAINQGKAYLSALSDVAKEKGLISEASDDEKRGWLKPLGIGVAGTLAYGGYKHSNIPEFLTNLGTLYNTRPEDFDAAINGGKMFNRFNDLAHERGEVLSPRSVPSAWKNTTNS